MKKIIITTALLAIAITAIPFFAKADPSQVQVPNPNGDSIVNNVILGLPGQTYSVEEKGIPALVANIYRFALLIGGFLAFGSIVWGLVARFANPGSVSAQEDSTDRIKQAFLGLLLLLGCYIVLSLVNPDLTKLNFPTLERLKAVDKVSSLTGSYACRDTTQANSPVVGCYTNNDCDNKCVAGKEQCIQTPACGAQGSPSAYGYQGVPLAPGLLTDAGVRSQFAIHNQKSSNKITVNKADCTQAGQTTCTSLDGVTQGSVDQIAYLADKCGTSLQVTGGTEAGHAEHGIGKAVFDIVDSGGKLASCFGAASGGVTGQTFQSKASQPAGCDVVYGLSMNAYYETAAAAGSSGNHWHVRFFPKNNCSLSPGGSYGK